MIGVFLNRQLICFIAVAAIFVQSCAIPPRGNAAFDRLEIASASSLDNVTSVAGDRATVCPAYVQSPIYRPRERSILIGPQDEWVDLIESAAAGTDIQLSDGTYHLRKHNVLVKDGITIRSASGARDSVLISGRGYNKSGEGFVIDGDNVTIADLSITAMRDHGISIKPKSGGAIAPHIYNLHLYDIGTQHIKSDIGGTRNGIVACSSIGYSRNGARGDYNGAIDLHGAISWIISDNTIYNIKGDGSGCNVDKDCGRYVSGPAILVWNKSSGTVVERNRIINSFRNIAFGLGRGHDGGVIRNNFIYRKSSGDAGIELQTVDGTLVENNAVLLNGTYRGSIEYRDTKNIVVRNNEVSSNPWNRGNNVSALSLIHI